MGTADDGLPFVFLCEIEAAILVSPHVILTAYACHARQIEGWRS